MLFLFFLNLTRQTLYEEEDSTHTWGETKSVLLSEEGGIKKEQSRNPSFADGGYPPPKRIFFTPKVNGEKLADKQGTPTPKNITQI